MTFLKGILNKFNKNKLLKSEDKKELQQIKKDAYMAEAKILVAENGTKKAREDFAN